MSKFFLISVAFLMSFSLVFSNVFVIDNTDNSETYLFVNGTLGFTGIGTDEPSRKLEVEDIGTVLNIDSSDSFLNKISLFDLGTLRSYLGANSSLLFSVSDSLFSIKFVVDSLGRVGIGTTNPREELEVVGDINATGDICILGGSCLSDVSVSDFPLDFSPDSFSFTNVSSQLRNKIIISDSIVLDSFKIGLIASVSGSGNPKLSVNGGTWKSQELVGEGDSIRVLARSTEAASSTSTVSLSIGTNSTTWEIGTGTGYFGIGNVSYSQKISDTEGNFLETLDDSDYFGTSIVNIGDLDGDGITDLAVGAYADDDGIGAGGAVYILFMNSDGTVITSQKISDTAGNFTETIANSDFFGYSLARIGDLDDDGITDLAVGAVGDDDGGSVTGAMYILFMNIDGTVSSSQKISDSQGNFIGVLDASDQFAFGIEGIGDLDGDGIEDIAAGANWDDDGGTNRGAVYILFMNSDGTVSSSQKISDTVGNFTETLDNDDQFGESIANMGDIDGDSIIDLAVCAARDDDGGDGRGACYILFMNSDGTVSSSQKISDTVGNFTETLDNSDYFGSSIGSIGDLDGNGITDLGVGAGSDDDGGNARGAVYILFMNSDGTVSSSQKISDTVGNFTETFIDVDYFGQSVTGLGDLDGDGALDIGVTALYDDDGGTNRGAIHILFMGG